MITRFLSRDLKTLRRLLTVNRLFFYAAVPLMLDDPIQNWQILHSRPRFKASLEKLFALILASVITHNREALPEDIALVSTGSVAAAVLRPFNLQLSQPVAFQLLRDCVDSPHKKTTVDYSKYFKHMGPSVWEYAELNTFVQLIDPPPEAIEENVDHVEPEVDVDNSGEEEELDEQEDHESEDDEEEEEEEEGDVDSEEETESESEEDQDIVYATESEQSIVQEQDVDTVMGDDDEVLSDIGSQSSWAHRWSTRFSKTSEYFYEEFSDYDEFGSDVSDLSEDEGAAPRDASRGLTYVTRALEEQISWPGPIDNQTFWGYKKVVRNALVDLLLHYNAESVHTMLFHVKDAHKYLEIAARMTELRHLHLQRDDDLPREHLEHTLEFIRLHRSAFPGRKSLNLTFGQGWEYFDFSIFHDDARKQAWSKFQEPVMKLYEAMEQPNGIHVYRFPRFYAKCAELEEALPMFCQNLETFRDDDDDRFASGESLDQERFLRRCHNLKELTLSVDSPEQLSFAVGATSTTSTDALAVSSVPRMQPTRPSTAPAPSPFGKLKKLTLSNTEGSSHSVLQVLDNSILAMNGSAPLRHIAVQSYNPELAVLELSTEHRMHRVGGWNLPALRSVYIDVDDMWYLPVGSWDQCPLLEHLRISSAPLAHQSIGYFDPAALDLYPVMNLPRLRLLQLCEAAALLFDYDSLKTLPSLKVLALSVPAEPRPFFRKGERWDTVERIPRLCEYLQKGSKSITTPQQKWDVDWSLPILTSLVLTGFPSAVFSFDWLKRCPALQRVTLESTKKEDLPLALHDHVALDAKSPVQWIKSPEESQMRELVIHGRWVMSEQDLITVLTDFTPNLRELTLDRIHSDGRQSGARILEVIDIADSILAKRGHQIGVEGHRIGSGCQLRQVNANYKLRRQDVHDWEVSSVRSRHLAKLEQLGVRVYQLANGPVVSKRTSLEIITRMDPKMREKFESMCTKAKETSF
ncbi:hypothetical protein BG005_005834 [Podila minutissima]|nr:hypothetical protein BG005_005834 [Podila minutissima]